MVEWACFASHQAAEKAAKALHRFFGAEAWGHDVRQILEEHGSLPGDVRDAASELDTFYVPTRCPDALPAGMPGLSDTGAQAERAIGLAEEVLEHVERSRLRAPLEVEAMGPRFAAEVGAGIVLFDRDR